MYVLFANAFPPVDYSVGVFLTSIIAMYLFRKICSFQETKHFVIAGLVVAALIVLHLVWF